VSIAFLVLHLVSTSLLMFLFYFSSSNIYYILPHIISHLTSLLATNNSSLPTPLSSTFLYVQLLVYYDITGLSLPSTPHLLVYILSVTNFIQLVSPQSVNWFSQTKLCWKAPKEGYLHICGMYKSDNKQPRYQVIRNCKSFVC